MGNKIRQIEEFSERFKQFKEIEEKNFSRIFSRLMGETYILKGEEEDNFDYFFLKENRDLFENFFALIDYEFIIDPTNSLIFIRTTENRNRLRLTKFDTAVILILRKLFYLKKKEILSEDKVIILLEEVMEQIRTTQVFDKEIKLSSYKASLMKLRQHKVIAYESPVIEENMSIQILPSIQIIIPQDKLEEIVARINALKKTNQAEKGVDDIEDTNED